MSDKLPKGWAKTTLGEVCARVPTIQPGVTPDSEFTYFDIGGIDNGTNRVVETKTVTGRDAPSRARQAAQTGDILFSTVRTYLKKIARIERDYPNPVASTGFTVLRAAEGVSSQFLFCRVLSEDFLQPLHALQTGSSYPAVRDKDVFAQPIPLPPTREQERIVTKLDALLSRVAAGEAAARRALERLERYRAAVLHAAVTGDLTSEWRKTHKPDETGAQLLQRILKARREIWEATEFKRLCDAGKKPTDDKWKSRYEEPKPPRNDGLPELPKGWTSATIEQISFLVQYGSSSKTAKGTNGIPVLRMGNIVDGLIDASDLKFLSVNHAEFPALLLCDGDLLFNRTNSMELVGKTAIYRGTPSPCSFASYLIRVRFLGGFAPEIAAHFINSALGRDWILSVASQQVGQANVNGSKLQSLTIPLPPQNEQMAIVREVERRFAAANRLASTLNRQLERARAMRQSLLRESFAGRLVQQNQNDEPASVLLDRIRAAREAEAKQPKIKRTFPRHSRKVARSTSRSRSAMKENIP